jgi:hypothetical protein
VLSQHERARPVISFSQRPRRLLWRLRPFLRLVESGGSQRRGVRGAVPYRLRPPRAYRARLPVAHRSVGARYGPSAVVAAARQYARWRPRPRQVRRAAREHAAPKGPLVRSSLITNKRRKYSFGMAVHTCKVIDVDLRGIEHTIAVVGGLSALAPVLSS